jgi:hypothetical protein
MVGDESDLDFEMVLGAAGAEQADESSSSDDDVFNFDAEVE